MGEVLAELERVLRADPKETITLDEELVLQKCKTRAVNTFLTSAGISSVLVWGATKKRFGMLSRTSFSIGAALFMGGWTFDKSLNSSVQSILAAHGTRMQREVTRIVMSKNLQDPRSPISKIFYPEHVYDDSSRDKPLVRWRARNFYQDGLVADSLEDDTTSRNKLPSGSEPTGQPRTPGADSAVAGLGDLIADPLDYILGYPEAGAQALQSNGPVISRRQTPAHKRRQRRHPARHDHNSPFMANPKTKTLSV